MKVRSKSREDKRLSIALKGTTRVPKKLASGDVRIYVYMGRGGEQLCSATGRNANEATRAAEALLGTEEVLRRYFELLAPRPEKSNKRQIFHAVAAYYDSPEFEGLKPSTKRDYKRYLESFRSEFGHYTVKVFEKPQVKEELHEWRENWRGKPRASDLAMSSVGVFFTYARSRGWTTAKPTLDIARLHKPDRSKKCWSRQDLDGFYAVASPEVGWVVKLAEYTLLRQGDLLSLPWSAIREDSIVLPTSKRGRVAVVPLIEEAKQLLQTIPRRSPIILTSSRGTPWTGWGFRSSFNKARIKAGVFGLDFHDVRGTGITRLYLAGFEERDIAQIVGWSLQDVKDMLAIYLNSDLVALDMVQRMKQKRPLTNR